MNRTWRGLLTVFVTASVQFEVALTRILGDRRPRHRCPQPVLADENEPSADSEEQDSACNHLLEAYGNRGL